MSSGSSADAEHADGRPRIVVLTAQGPLSHIVVNGLAARLGPLTVIREHTEHRSDMLRRRIRLLGWTHTAGQLALAVALHFDPRRKARLARVWQAHGLDPTPRADLVTHTVPSINAPECRALLQALAPDVVAVFGTRILKPETLAAVPAPFINYHAGITPKYRGQDPAYWALANDDAAHAGVTIHLVDKGVDTGPVLYQATVAFGPEDMIATYQHVQAATALPLFAQAITDALENRLAPIAVDLPSRSWFPPTLWGYLTTGFTRGVW